MLFFSVCIVVYIIYYGLFQVGISCCVSTGILFLLIVDHIQQYL